MPTAAKKAKAVARRDVQALGGHPRRPGRAPQGYEWDSLTGEWLDAAGLPRPAQQTRTNQAAHRHAPGQRVRSAAARRARAAPYPMRGRTALKLMAMDADARKAVGLADIGQLGACTQCCVGRDAMDTTPCAATDDDEHKRARLLCTHCGALLFAGEAVKTQPHLPYQTCWRGRFCCANGSVDMRPVERSPAVDALYADAQTGNLLRDDGRHINNALALASAKCKKPGVPGPGCDCA